MTSFRSCFPPNLLDNLRYFILIFSLNDRGRRYLISNLDFLMLLEHFDINFLTIISRVRMGYESIAIDSEAMKARGIIVLVKSN